MGDSDGLGGWRLTHLFFSSSNYSSWTSFKVCLLFGLKKHISTALDALSYVKQTIMHTGNIYKPDSINHILTFLGNAWFQVQGPSIQLWSSILSSMHASILNSKAVTWEQTSPHLEQCKQEFVYISTWNKLLTYPAIQVKCPIMTLLSFSRSQPML